MVFCFDYQIESAIPSLAKPMMSLDATEDAIVGTLKQSLVYPISFGEAAIIYLGRDLCSFHESLFSQFCFFLHRGNWKIFVLSAQVLKTCSKRWKERWNNFLLIGHHCVSWYWNAKLIWLLLDTCFRMTYCQSWWRLQVHMKICSGKRYQSMITSVKIFLKTLKFKNSCWGKFRCTFFDHSCSSTLLFIMVFYPFLITNECKVIVINI